MSSNFFDRLPVEIVHEIFNYLWAHEICYSFHNATEYVNKIIETYDRYLINFRWARKTHFDLTCRLLRPDQIISLSLADKDTAPEQCKLFFAFFSIKRFVNLRSFQMDSFDESTFEQLRNLLTLERLTSLYLPSRLWHSVAFKSFVQSIMPRLHRLTTDDCSFSQPLENLQHLTLTRCHCTEIMRLFKTIAHVRSLHITIVDYRSLNWPTEAVSLMELRQFSIKIENNSTTINEIQSILRLMPNLKYLELDISGTIHLLDGSRWKPLVVNLTKFDFHFHMLHWSWNEMLSFDDLNAFRTSFWLEEKQWYVAMNSHQPPSIFTVPRFAPRDLQWPSENILKHCTYNCFNPNHYVEQLKFASLQKNLSSGHEPDIQKLIEDRPRLYSLTICNSLVFDILYQGVIYEQIRILYFNFQQKRTPSFLPEDIATIFPKLESLNTLVSSPQELFIFIDRLKYLSNAHFRYDFSIGQSCIGSRRRVTRQWLIRNSRRLSHNKNFTSVITDRVIRLWMCDKEESTSFLKKLLKSNR